MEKILKDSVYYSFVTAFGCIVEASTLVNSESEFRMSAIGEIIEHKVRVRTNPNDIAMSLFSIHFPRLCEQCSRGSRGFC